MCLAESPGDIVGRRRVETDFAEHSKVTSRSMVRPLHSGDCIRIQMCAPWPSMFASIRTTGTVFLRQLEFPFFFEAGDALFGGEVVVAFSEDLAAGVLSLDAASVELIDSAVLLVKFVVMFVDVRDNGIELLARLARHGPVDEFEVVAAVKVVEDIHHRQPMPFDLRAAAEIDDAGRLRVHGFGPPTGRLYFSGECVALADPFSRDWASMFASTRTPDTVLLRQLVFPFFFETGDALFAGQVIVAFGEDAAAGALRLDAALVELIDSAGLLDQLSVMFVDVRDNRIDLLACEARHGPMDEIKIVAAVKVIEDVHYRQPSRSDLNEGTANSCGPVYLGI